MRIDDLKRTLAEGAQRLSGLIQGRAAPELLELQLEGARIALRRSGGVAPLSRPLHLSAIKQTTHAGV